MKAIDDDRRELYDQACINAARAKAGSQSYYDWHNRAQAHANLLGMSSLQVYEDIEKAEKLPDGFIMPSGARTPGRPTAAQKNANWKIRRAAR